MMMHVAHLIGRLKRDGGAEKLIQTFAHAASSLNLKLTIITLRENDPQVQREVEALGARVISFPGRKLGNPFRFWQLLRFIQQEKFELIHTHLSDETILGISIGQFLGIPVVCTIHNTRMTSQDNPVRDLLEPWLYRYGASQIIAVGWTTASVQGERIGNKSITVIPNAVLPINDLSTIERNELRKELVGNAEYPLLISVGRLTPQKGFLDLITAFAILHKSNPRSRMIIVGQGPQDEELITKIQHLNLQSKVKLLGLRSDVPRLMAASDIYVSASLWEGLPVATLEAMSAGLPIVATNVGDVPQVVIEGTGILVPPRQPEELALAIGYLLDHDERSRIIGKVARNHVQRTFGVENWINMQLEIYEKVINTRGAKTNFVMRKYN